MEQRWREEEEQRRKEEERAEKERRWKEEERPEEELKWKEEKERICKEEEQQKRVEVEKRWKEEELQRQVELGKKKQSEAETWQEVGDSGGDPVTEVEKKRWAEAQLHENWVINQMTRVAKAKSSKQMTQDFARAALAYWRS